jgi:hypothetical protein
MDDLVHAAASAVLPFVGGSAAVAAEEFAKHTGTGASEAFARIVNRLWRRSDLGEREAGIDEVKRVLRASVDDGTVTAEDLALVAQGSTTVTSTTIVNSTNTVMGTVTIETGNFTQNA